MIHNLAIGVTSKTDAVFDIGWIKWANEGKPTVLLTKNFIELHKKYPYVVNTKHIMVSVTLTGNGGTVFEPNIPTMEEHFEYFEKLSDEERKRILIRIDPIVPIHRFFKNSLIVYLKCKELGFEHFAISCLDIYCTQKDGYIEKNLPKELEEELNEIYFGENTVNLIEPQAQDCWKVHADYKLRKFIFDFFPDARICNEPNFKCGCGTSIEMRILGYNLNDYPTIEGINQGLYCGCEIVKVEISESHNCQYKCSYCPYLKKRF